MSNENNIKIKDPEGREYDDSGSATLKKVISVICVIFSLVGIITNSIYPLTGMKKGGIFLGFTVSDLPAVSDQNQGPPPFGL